MILPTVFVLLLVVGVYGAIDAAVRPFDHWQRTGHNKAAWVTAQLLVLIPIANLAGIAAALYYLAKVRSQLKTVAGDLSL